MHLTVLDVESTVYTEEEKFKVAKRAAELSLDRKREASKLNVGVVLIIAIREISNHENEFDVNSQNVRPSKITRYTVYTVFAVITAPLQLKRHPAQEHNFSSLNLAPCIFLNYFRRRLAN